MLRSPNQLRISLLFLTAIEAEALTTPFHVDMVLDMSGQVFHLGKSREVSQCSALAKRLAKMPPKVKIMTPQEKLEFETQRRELCDANAL